ncbi:helix-hairpin-helix domain-containing protein [Nitrosomonas sp.]|uniref:ComEA family DNA-binding protein n=1 Tax=Nitrosomonas sp. TaxID=42353 RepID=UPI0025F96DAB|nr:helix-hairpin-helix domain-containing protein [Nitrosomonas sp.]MBV6448264.1 hypothetical protein [Nitrosomonas sp.]
MSRLLRSVRLSLRLLRRINQRFLKSKAIIEYREKSGAFTSVDDLAKVSGIGPGTIKQLRDAVTVEGEKSTETPAKPE